MSLYFPGTRGWILPSPTPQFRYDIGIAGGHPAFSIWIKPDDVTYNQEIVAIVEAAGYVLTVLRLEGSFAHGSLIAITQADLFGFCTVRRTVADVIVPGVWQNVLVACETGMHDMHVYIDGVEPSYAFTRSEAGLPMNGGGDILIGCNFRGDGVTAPHYPAGVRIVSGDAAGGWTHDPALVYLTSPGTFFKGGLAHTGFWFAGLANLGSEIAASLAAGYSPLFMNHKIDGSTFSRGLMMAPGLYGEDVDEYDPLTGIKGDEASPGSGSLSWIDGPPVVEPCPPEIEGPGPIIPTTPRLCLPFGLPRAEIYDNPGNPADILPIVYGDFSRGGLRGPVPAVLIDLGLAPTNAGPYVFCAAYHPLISIDAVYIDDVVQDPASYTVSLSNNFQGHGTIATITFTIQPQGQVNWRGQGHYDSTGAALMENCLDQIIHLLTTYGNFDLDEDFDLTSVVESMATINTLGYKTAFVVMDEQVTQDWITEMLFNVMGYWRVNGAQQLEFHVDSGYSSLSLTQIDASILAARDCENGDDGIEFILDKKNIVNTLTTYYLYSYSLQQPSSRLVSLRDNESVSAYGEIHKAVTLKGLRRAVDVAVWATILLARQSARTRVEGAQINLTLRGGRYGHLSIGDLIAVSWPYGPTRENDHEYMNEVCRIENMTLDLTKGGAIQITATDLGIYVADGSGNRLLTPVEV